MTETLYEQARHLGRRVVAADLPIGAVRPQVEALCRAQDWGTSDPRRYDVAHVAFQAYRAAKQYGSLREQGSGEP